jgi:hypothetical protein
VSKLVLRAPRDYDAGQFQDILTQLSQQSNLHAEGKLVARHGAMTAVPTAANWERGDIVWNSSPVSGGPVGWVCVTSGTPGTWHQFGGMPALGTEVAATSGTSIDFTGIPSWVKRITIQFVGVSTNGTSDWIVQLGDSGGAETTGYLSAASFITNVVDTTNYTAGFGLAGTTAFGADSVVHGKVILSLEDATQFTWTMIGILAQSQGGILMLGAGSKSLSAALDRIRITTAGGTDTFDAGAINILYQ